MIMTVPGLTSSFRPAACPAPLSPCLHCHPSQKPSLGFCSERGDSHPPCIQRRQGPQLQLPKRGVRFLFIAQQLCPGTDLHAFEHINSVTYVQISLSESLSAPGCLQVFRGLLWRDVDQLFSMSPVGGTKGKGLKCQQGVSM